MLRIGRCQLSIDGYLDSQYSFHHICTRFHMQKRRKLLLFFVVQSTELFKKCLLEITYAVCSFQLDHTFQAYLSTFSLVAYEIFFYLCQDTVLRYKILIAVFSVILESTVFPLWIGSPDFSVSTLSKYSTFSLLFSKKPCLLHFFSCLVLNICFHSYCTAYKFASKVVATEKFLYQLKVLELFRGIFGN